MIPGGRHAARTACWCARGLWHGECRASGARAAAACRLQARLNQPQPDTLIAMTTRIEDYAMIGNMRTAALVGKNGSIDWLCVPRFDSGACFAALLGDAENGRWLIAPQGEGHTIRRRYRDDTLILET